jgi:hypothetical protein
LLKGKRMEPVKLDEIVACHGDGSLPQRKRAGGF